MIRQLPQCLPLPYQLQYGRRQCERGVRGGSASRFIAGTRVGQRTPETAGKIACEGGVMQVSSCRTVARCGRFVEMRLKQNPAQAAMQEFNPTQLQETVAQARPSDSCNIKTEPLHTDHALLRATQVRSEGCCLDALHILPWPCTRSCYDACTAALDHPCLGPRPDAANEQQDAGHSSRPGWRARQARGCGACGSTQRSGGGACSISSSRSGVLQP